MGTGAVVATGDDGIDAVPVDGVLQGIHHIMAGDAEHRALVLQHRLIVKTEMRGQLRQRDVADDHVLLAGERTDPVELLLSEPVEVDTSSVFFDGTALPLDELIIRVILCRIDIIVSFVRTMPVRSS